MACNHCNSFYSSIDYMRVISNCANQKLLADNAAYNADRLARALESCLIALKKASNVAIDEKVIDKVIADCEATLSSYYDKKSP